MRYILFFALLLMITASFGQDFYKTDTIHTIELTFEESNWDDVLYTNYDADNGDRLLATAVINGIVFDSVGVKYKGNSSCNTSHLKNPFNIKLDYIINNQEIDDYGTLKLSNVFKDPSFVREVLGYEIARNYMPAPRANFIKVFVNGSYHGLYSNVQTEDKEFLRQNFNNYDDGIFFKGEFANNLDLPGCPTGPPEVWGYIDDSTCAQKYYELESDYGWQELLNFLDTFNNVTSQMEEVLDVDRHLWMLTFDNLLVSLDAPTNIPHNFYLYRDQTERFNPLLWDCNMTFGGFTSMGGPSSPSLTTTELQELDVFMNETSANYPIVSKVLSNDRYKKMYVAHMKTMLEEIFTSNWYQTRVGELQTMIDADVQADNNKFFTYTDFQNNLSSTAANVIGLAELMEARATYIQGLTEFQYSQPVISNIVVPDTASPFSTILITADISNANYAYVGYRHSKNDKFTKVEMFDDGAHEDGAAGDGTYGAYFDIDISNTHYYIYAENSDAAIFSPERAEYEFYSFTANVNVGIQSDVVINELMASNSETQSDEAGDFNDWIELYNNTENTINLSGYYLSDDEATPNKWALPDVSINADSYLIVWADNEEVQGTMHANFKLSASGEAVYLVDPSLTIIDQVEYAIQTTDVVYARVPNGTGAFVSQAPSFSFNNNYPYSVDEIDLDNAFVIYPNPSKGIVNIKGMYDIKSIEVSNITGQVITIFDVNNKTALVNLTDEAAGVYFIKIATDKGMYCDKIILN